MGQEWNPEELLPERQPSQIPPNSETCAVYGLRDNFRAIVKDVERYVLTLMFNFIKEAPFQSGFIQGDSITFQLLHTHHSLLVDSDYEVRVVFCGFSKAFDRGWQKGLLHKLTCMGISGCLLRWLQS